MRVTIPKTEYLTIANLREQVREGKDMALWVLNTSDLEGRREHGTVIIEVQTKNGKATSIVIEKTWIPQDLTVFVNKADLVDSTSFLQEINKGIIRPISSAAAEKIMEREDAQTVKTYLQLKRQGVTETAIPDSALLGSGAPRSPAQFTAEENANMQVQQIMGRDDDSFSPDMKLASLLNIQNELNTNDYRFILSKCVDPSYAKIQKFAQTAAASASNQSSI